MMKIKILTKYLFFSFFLSDREKITLIENLNVEIKKKD